MAANQNRSYSQFNFRLVISSGTNSIQAGFQEVSGMGMEITVAEYRSGSLKTYANLKVPGTFKVPGVSLKRGIIGAEEFYEWIGQVEGGSQEEALRSFEIHLLSEDQETSVMTWILSNARIIKYTGLALNVKGPDVSIEELVLACEGINLLTEI